MNFSAAYPGAGVFCPEDNHPPQEQLILKSDKALAFTIPVAFDSIPLSELSAIRGRVYEHVCRRAATSGKCYEAVLGMAEYLECSEDTIRRSLNELCEKRILSRQRRSGETSVYTLTAPSIWQVKLKESHLASPRQATTPPLANLLLHPSQTCYTTPRSRATQRNNSKKQFKETTTNQDVVVVSFEKIDPELEPELTGKQINTPVEQHESSIDESDHSQDTDRDHLFRRAENLIGDNLTSALEQEINKHSIARVEAALEALQETLEQGKVKSPSGFLMKALQGGWTPSERVQEEKGRPEVQEFSEWFNLAKAADIVIASQQQGDEIFCHTRDNKCIPFRDLIATHSIEALRQVVEEKKRAEAVPCSAPRERSLDEPAFT